MVASESIKIYTAISDGTVNLVDKFFEMQRHDALKALDVYRRAGHQAERLSEFYEICKNLDHGRGERFIKIEQPPASFVQAMEEYVREAPHSSTARKDLGDDKPKGILAIEYKTSSEAKDEHLHSPPLPEPEPELIKVETPVSEPSTPDLLGLNEPTAATELDEKNSLASAIVPAEQPVSAGQNLSNGTSGWELALVTAPSSNETAATTSQLAGGFDKLTLDSLYDDAIRRSNQTVSYNPWEQGPVANSMTPHDPFYASNGTVATQQHPFTFHPHQQQTAMMMGPQQAMNPYAVVGFQSHPYGASMAVPAYNPYSGLI